MRRPAAPYSALWALRPGLLALLALLAAGAVRAEPETSPQPAPKPFQAIPLLPPPPRAPEPAEIPAPPEPAPPPAELPSAAKPTESSGPAPEAERRPWQELRERAESRLTRLRRFAAARLAPEAREALAAAPQPGSDAWVLLAGLCGALALALLTLRSLWGRGDVAVCIEYPAELRGTFSVRLARRKQRPKTGGRVPTAEDALNAKERAGAASAFRHPLVSRETKFQRVPSRLYHVSIEGFLQRPDSDDVISAHFEEQEVRVRRGHSVRLEFDLHPKDCSLEVKPLWDRRPAAEALVAVRGDPHSLRRARGSAVLLRVPPGRHTLVVGSGDRVAEQEISVDPFQPASFAIDLQSRDHLVFTGCPPAVESYLRGDVPAAARALERDGQTQISHLLLARFHRDHGQQESAARHYEEAGCPREAAELRRELEQFAASAELFDRAGDPARAAEMYRTAGDLGLAGQAYQRARDLDSAVVCFREAGDVARWIEALEQSGAPFDAARVAIERGDWSRAIRSLQMVGYSDPNFLEAANLLADAYEREGHADLATRKLEELLATVGEDKIPLESCERLVNLLVESEAYDRALEVLDLIRRRDVTYPSVSTRIEELRKRRSGDREPDPRTLSGAAAFSSEFRYEILEEIGRGGMGVVFRARDRRLGRVVALKRLPENLRNHPKAVQLFLREARAAAALNHANIVTVYDAGQEGDSYYITMELLEGSPLQEILRSRGRLKPRDTARLGLQITRGLQYAHDQRIIHRDIKTANLFFTLGKRLKIMDFGLAKMVEEVRKSSTLIGGTPYYMAPEQSMGGAVDHRADLYAFGVTLFELVTGTLPFTEGDVAFHHRHTAPPDPRTRCEDVPEAMSALILQMLAKTPEERCASAAEVGERLQEIARDL